ncbi:MAG: TonB-dependent receptor, partial [Chryseobacterium sp.]|nr:TonB-dependent receptor [Chryseobacterium sp.]
MKYITTITLLMLSVTQNITAQVLKGFIKDKRTNDFISGVSLEITGLEINSLSDKSGNFTIAPVPKTGTYTITVNHKDYTTKTVTVDFNNRQQIEILLEPVFQELEEVTITGTPISSANRFNSTSAKVLKKEDLQNASTNIIDALASQVPGVSQMTTGPAISKPLIRGLGSNRVITMNGGIKQQGQQWGDEHGIEIDQNQAGRIEVLRGAASLMYGSDAIGGVINILDPEVPHNGKVVGELISSYSTNNGLTNNSAMVTGNQNGLVWRARGSYQNANDFQTPLGYFKNSGYNTTSASGMMGVKKNWGYSLLNFSYFDNNIGFNEMESIDDIYSNHQGSKLDFPKQNIKHYKLTLNNNFEFKSGSLKVDAGYQRNQRKEFEDSSDPSLFFDLSTYSLDGKFTFNEKNGWKPVIGISGNSEQSENKGSEYLNPAYQRYSFGAFGFIKKTIGQTTYSAGVRYDYITNRGDQLTQDGEEVFTGFYNSFNNVSGALGFTHIFSDRINIKANAGSAFRAPNPAELGSNGIHRGTNRFQKGNANLKAERSYQADIAFEYRHDILSGSIGVYNNYMN